MALTTEQRRILRIAIAEDVIADAIADQIDAGGNPQAANVAVIGTTTNLVGVDGTGSNAAPLAGTESRLDAIEAKVDAVITALVNAGLMASS